MDRVAQVFRMNDCDWWIGYDLESVVKDYVSHTGQTTEEVMDDDPRMLTPMELRKLKFYKEPPFNGPYQSTFWSELDRRRRSSEPIPGPFATTEW